MTMTTAVCECYVENGGFSYNLPNNKEKKNLVFVDVVFF